MADESMPNLTANNTKRKVQIDNLYEDRHLDTLCWYNPKGPLPYQVEHDGGELKVEFSEAQFRDMARQAAEIIAGWDAQ